MTQDTSTVTDAGAAAAILSPFWLPTLHHISVITAELLPILGALWLVVQIVAKLYTTYSRRNHEID